MEPIDLLNHPEITRCPMQELKLDLPTLPTQSRELLEMARAYIVKNDDCNEVIYAKDFHVSGDLKLKRYAKPDSWKSISALYIDGNLTIEGDLLNDGEHSYPILIVKGDLILRSWLRGGMLAYIGGSIRASGVLVDKYNDGGLFVGGDLIAEGGFIHCREPYPDMPDIQPHQIRGEIRAKSFDATIPDINNDLLQKTFAPEVLDVFFENGGLWYDSGKVIKRAAEGLSIWREPKQIQS